MWRATTDEEANFIFDLLDNREDYKAVENYGAGWKSVTRSEQSFFACRRPHTGASLNSTSFASNSIRAGWAWLQAGGFVSEIS